jgi:hypothetical protein
MIRVARYTITATSLSPIRIGGREDPLSGADNPVAVVGGRVCVPGPRSKALYAMNLSAISTMNSTIPGADAGLPLNWQCNPEFRPHVLRVMSSG